MTLRQFFKGSFCFRHYSSFRWRGVRVCAVRGAAPVGHADYRPAQEGVLCKKQSVSSKMHRFILYLGKKTTIINNNNIC